MIDPVIVYGTYLGGTGGDVAQWVAVDSSGDAYLAGYTTSADFPLTRPARGTYGGNTDAFVTKLDPSGSPVYSTYLGGQKYDVGAAVAVDSGGSAYVTGRTGSSDFPTLNAYQPAFAGGNRDAYVTKLDGGGQLAYSTYLGGTGFDLSIAIAVDRDGHAYVTGHTTSTDYPTVKPLQATEAGSDDIIVSEFTPGGSGLLYSTYLGGTEIDEGADIALGPDGAIYVVGHTSSTDYPTASAVQPAYAGPDYDGFALKLAPGGGSLTYSTYLGGAGTDFSAGVAVDGAGSAYVASQGDSPNFPVARAIQPTPAGARDAMVTKLGSAGALVYSTYLGGGANDVARSIAVDSKANAYVTGDTASSDFPTAGALQPAFAGGGRDAFLFELPSAGDRLVYSSYLGGSGSDTAFALALDQRPNAYVVGQTSSPNFPLGGTPHQPSGAGGMDAFLVKFDMTSPTPPPPPPPSPPPPPPPVPPRLTLGGARLQRPLRRKRIYVLAHSDQAAGLTAIGRIRVGGRPRLYRVRAARGQASPRRTVVLILRLTHRTATALRKAFKAHRRARASVVVSARAESGESAQATKRVRLGREPRRRVRAF